jgi:galactose-1-phosphate uridylyltransferase
VIPFASTTERAVLLDPAGNRVEQVIEHRVDPLTGAVASINAALGEKARAFLGAPDLDALRDLEEKSRATCPFCGAAERGTRFPPELVPEGRLRIGRSLVLPNLFSKCRIDTVVVVDPAAHLLLPSRLAPDALGTAIEGAAEVVRRARAIDPGLVHHVAGMNFLQPAGSSVPHPHLQVQARGVPYSAVARLVEAGAAWRARTERDYWETLLEAERGGPRFLGRTGPVEWVAAFAPTHQREVWGLLPGMGSLAELGAAEAAAFAAGLSRVVSTYEELGVHSFNFGFLSAPRTGQGGAHALQVRVCARPAFRPFYVSSDTWFAPKLCGDDVHLEAPELLAERMRPAFGAAPVGRP